MNRHARRRAAAMGRTTGYMSRLVAAQSLLERGRVFHAVVQHDAGCGIYRSGICDCTPDISVHPEGGGDVIKVDAEGRMRKMAAN